MTSVREKMRLRMAEVARERAQRAWQEADEQEEATAGLEEEEEELPPPLSEEEIAYRRQLKKERVAILARKAAEKAAPPAVRTPPPPRQAPTRPAKTHRVSKPTFQHRSVVFNQPAAELPEGFERKVGRGLNLIVRSSTLPTLLPREVAERLMVAIPKAVPRFAARAEHWVHKTANCNRITINGEEFAVVKRGSQLMPLRTRTFWLMAVVSGLAKIGAAAAAADVAAATAEGTETNAGDTNLPDITTLLPFDGHLAVARYNSPVEYNGRQYSRAKNGSYRRVAESSATSTNPLQEPSVKKQERCKFFTRTGMCVPPRSLRTNTPGMCTRAKCSFAHNPRERALCPYYVKGGCTNQRCPLSHTPVPQNVPTCKYFLEGGCTNEVCVFLHNTASPPRYEPAGETWDPNRNVVCRPFAIDGWCDDGVECRWLHSYDCPDLNEPAGCPRGAACKLLHVRRAHMLPRSHGSHIATGGVSITVDTEGDPGLGTDARLELVLSDSDFDTSDEEIDPTADFVHV